MSLILALTFQRNVDLGLVGQVLGPSLAHQVSCASLGFDFNTGKTCFRHVSDDELSENEEQDESVNTAAAADSSDDEDDNEYFEDVVLTPSLAELRQQVIDAIGQSQFNHVFSVVQVSALSVLQVTFL